MLLSASNQTKAANLLGLSWNEVHTIQERAIQRGLRQRDLSDTTHLGIDEKSFLKGQSYGSLLYDLDESRVLEVVKDRTAEAATTLLEVIPIDQRAKIEAVAVDMWKPFIASIENTFPQADIVHDKFHVIAYLNEAVDDVRRKEHKELHKNGEDLLKGTRFLWLKNLENLTEQDETTFDSLQKEGLKIGRAWSIAQTFFSIWDYVYEGAARTFFDKLGLLTLV